MNRTTLDLPLCPNHKIQMFDKPLAAQSKDEKWCGTWFECREPGCFAAVLQPSRELTEHLQKQITQQPLANAKAV